MSELKSGDSLDFPIGDKTLTLEPVPFGNVKKVLKILMSAAGDRGLSDIASMPQMLDKYLVVIFPLLFPRGRYDDFLTAEWIEDNMTIPTMRKMLEAAIVVNGLQDFFEKILKKTKANLVAAQESEPIPAIPSAPAGSTTSADSPTDGGPKT